MSEERVQRRLAAILATDVVGYSRLMGQDEAGTLKQLKTLRSEVFAPKADEYGGRIVKTMGDGLLIEFSSAVDALEYAIDTQEIFARRNRSLPDDRRIEFRMGINLGDVIVDGDDIYGDGVNVAARLEGLADAGGICVSAMVYEGVRGKLEVTFSDIGDQSLKNIAEPVHVYRVQVFAAEGTDEAEISPDALFRRPVVAVMPFENMSGDPDQEFFVDGLTEDLITALSQWRSFPVIARNSTFAYKGQSPDIRRVGKELGARYVIEGSVRRSGNRVRVTAQLINADTGHHVWTERYDRNIEDFLDLQDEITQEIAAVIAPELNRAEQLRAAGKRPERLDAWECYQRGMALWQTQKQDAVGEARALFEQAIKLDPTFGRPYVGYVLTYRSRRRLGIGDSERERALLAAKHAVELDSADALAHFALGMIHYLDREMLAAISEFEHAIQLNPSFAEAHASLGNALSGSGRAEEALPHIDRAIRLNPRDPSIGPTYDRKARAHLFLHQHEEAVKWAQRGLRYQNTTWPLRADLASALAHLDRLDEARRTLDEMNEHWPGITIEFVRAHTMVSDPSYMDHLLDGLRKAGLPD